MAEHQLTAAQNGEALPHKDYTMALLQRAAVQGTIPAEKLESLRKELHQAAAGRAAAYTMGKSGTVTRQQAEALYASVFCQLDAALLGLDSDTAAEEALRSQTLAVLLEAGQLRSLQMYEEAKTAFRKAYLLSKPYHTTLYRGLLKDFEWFCTKYDARFRAAETKVQYAYPLLTGEEITEKGVIGVHRYYTALLREAELLKLFPQDELAEMMQRYAEKYRTDPEMIAENIAELALRHALTAALNGADILTVLLTEEQLTEIEERYCRSSAVQIGAELKAAAERLIPQEQAASAGVYDMLPAMASAMHTRIQAGRLHGWLAYSET